MKSFFYPENVVVIGVSEKPTNMGQMIVQNLIHGGFSGQVHAVGPSGGVILGRPIRKSVKDIIFPLDLAVIMTPAVTIPLLMRECGEAGIRRFEALHSNKVTSMGNKLNVDESDLLEYLVNEDDGTEIICMYLEGFSNAIRLMQIARQSQKPIILHKSGVGKAGAAMAASHTAALASDDKVVEAALAQAGIILVHTYGEAEIEESRHLIKIIKALSEKHGKPVALCLMVDDRERAYLKQNFDFPIFKTPEYAANALKASRKLYMCRQKQMDFIPFEKQVDIDAAHRIVDNAVKENRNPGQAECFDILKLYGLPVPAYQWVQTKAEAVTAATEIGTPIVLKVDVPTIIHKSDVGGVVLNLKTPEAVGAAFDALENKLQGIMGPADRFAALVMEQVVVDGKEVILGVNQDETFGPTLLFGLGGVFAELLKDVSLRVVPLDRNEVMGMIQEVKGFKALTGARGQKPVDLDVLADNLLNLAQLARDFTQIKEIDLNPVLVNSEGAWVLDVRFLI